MAEAVERQLTSISKHEEHIKALELRAEAQAAALHQMRLEVMVWKSVQSAAGETVQEVRREVAHAAGRTASAVQGPWPCATRQRPLQPIVRAPPSNARNETQRGAQRPRAGRGARCP